MRLETEIRAVVVAACLAIAQQAVGQTNQASTNQPQTKPTLPGQDHLGGRHSYNAVRLIRVEPDGLLVKLTFQMEAGKEWPN